MKEALTPTDRGRTPPLVVDAKGIRKEGLTWHGFAKQVTITVTERVITP